MNNTYRVCVSIIVIVLVGIRSNAQVSQAWAVKYNGAGSGYDTAVVRTTLFDGLAEAGKYYTLKLDGSKLASGLYFYRLQSGQLVATRKLTLLK